MRCGMRVAFAARMLRTRPVWMRGLRLYRSIASAGVLERMEAGDDIFDTRIHARSRFRSEDDVGQLIEGLGRQSGLLLSRIIT